MTNSEAATKIANEVIYSVLSEYNGFQHWWSKTGEKTHQGVLSAVADCIEQALPEQEKRDELET